MKSMHILRQLNTSLTLLVFLLLAGVGVAGWVEHASSVTNNRTEELVGTIDKVACDLALWSDAIRGLLLDPHNEVEARHRVAAEADLRSNLNALQKDFAQEPELVEAARNLSDCVLARNGEFQSFRTQMTALVEDDPSGAATYYAKNYPTLLQQRERLFRDLSNQVARLKNAEEFGFQKTWYTGLSAIVVILLATFVMGRWQSTAIAAPLNRLVLALERMRQGDFTHRLTSDREDEFGVVSEGLDRLADDLSTLVGQVQRSGLQVNTTAEEIAATFKEQQDTAHEIAATTADIGTTSKQISATSRELVHTMNEVSQVAEETAGLAGTGQAAITRMESTMRQVMDASGAVTAKLAVLSEKTTNINSVVTTITKVADQTNLLSLNAAIEAEKAGEYGLGFAVVAMEIRRLADQTAVATYDIEKMVKEMQSAVVAGVMGMDKFSEEVRRGVNEVHQVSKLLAQIIHQVQTLTPRFQTVNAGMQAQANGAQQISETLTQLNEAVQQTVASLRQSNLAIAQLNSAAHGLQTSVARFKLNQPPPRLRPGPEELREVARF